MADLREKRVDLILQQLEDLPTLPAVALRVLEITGDNESSAKDVVKLHTAKTVEGGSLAIKTMNGGVMVNDANVTKTDIATSNGVIHVVDTVLLPK